jgi:hypothetical protein
LTLSERDLAVRGVAALIPATGIVLLCIAGRTRLWPALGVIPCMGIMMIMLYPSLSTVIGERTSGFLFWPHRRERPRAPLSRVDYFLVNEQWDAAEVLLEDLGRRFPYDLAVWTRLFRVVWLRSEGLEHARAAHGAALRCSADPGLWPKLNHLYLLFAQARLGDGEELAAEERALERRVEAAARSLPRGWTLLPTVAGLFRQD